MGKAKFTPGPWVADIRVACCAVYQDGRQVDTNGCHRDDDRNVHYSSDATRSHGNDGMMRWNLNPEAEANAHLISSAPEMYEMLETIHSDDECKIPEWKRKSIQMMLAKARGEQ